MGLSLSWDLNGRSDTHGSYYGLYQFPSEVLQTMKGQKERDILKMPLSRNEDWSSPKMYFFPSLSRHIEKIMNFTHSNNLLSWQALVVHFKMLSVILLRQKCVQSQPLSYWQPYLKDHLFMAVCRRALHTTIYVPVPGLRDSTHSHVIASHLESFNMP